MKTNKAEDVQSLAGLMQNENFETARTGKRGLWRIVHLIGRPGAEKEKKKVIYKLISLLKGNLTVNVKREILWMLSEIGGDESVKPVAEFLSNKDMQEDSRMVLERIPGEISLKALQAALRKAPKEFKLNIIQSLRKRGIAIKGFPCIKLKPKKR